jgi:signal transduction histidine kinase
MFDIYQSSVIITALFFTGFGGFAIWNNKKDISARLFALLSAAFAVWSYSWFGLLSVTSDVDVALFFARLLNLGATFIPIFFMHWVFVTLNNQKKARVFIYIGYIVTIVFALFSFSDLYISGVKSISIFPFWPVAGILYKFFVIFGYVGLILIGLIFLIRGFFNSVGEQRHRIIFLFIGSFLGFIGGGMNFPLMFGYVIPQPYDLIGVFMLMTSPFMFSYAAIHYKLFDLKNVAIQLFAGALNIVFITNVLLAKTFYNIFISSLLLIFTLWFTVLIIKILKKEVAQRERIESLANSIKSVNNILSHDIKGVLGKNRSVFAEMLLGTFGTISEEAKNLLKQLSNDTDKVLESVMAILDSGQEIKLSPERYDLKAQVLDVVWGLKEEADKKSLALDVKIDDKEDFNILADKKQLQTHVIKNLIENAINYTLQGTIVITLSKNTPKTVLLSIKDTGVGITSEDREKLFTEGGHGVNSIKINVHSTGYGLFIAKKITDAHKGKIWVESEGAGKGSTFFVELPVA